jgi:hypothetical protein
MRRSLSSAIAALACLAIAGCATSSQAPSNADANFETDSGIEFDTGSDATTAETGSDAGEDVPGSDATMGEAGSETGADSSVDSAVESSVEASVDTGVVESGGDVVVGDTGIDALPEASSDATPDVRPMCVNPASDCPSTGSLCKVPTCSAGVCAVQNAAATTPCSDSGGNVCDKYGNCIASCFDGVQDDGETDLDCGGAYCDSGGHTCADGKKCLSGPDCQSKVCSGMICQVPTCSDGQMNGGETGVDCGGPCAALAVPQTCPPGDLCNTASDCTSGYCTSSATCALRPNGQQCWNGPSNCVSGFCANIPGNQICCDATCAGNCQTCGGGYPGLTYGQCGQIPAGQFAPSGKCTSNGTCGNDGKCTAGGTCEQQPVTVSCTQTCVGTTLTAAGFCDGNGGCGGVQSSCVPYACSSIVPLCNTTCSTGSDCAPGYNCVGGACM